MQGRGAWGRSRQVREPGSEGLPTYSLQQAHITPQPTAQHTLRSNEHGRGTSRGVFSSSPPTVVPRPNSPGRTVNSYGQAIDSAEYLTRTQAKVVWEDGRWQIVQHFPGVKDFDRPTRVYSQDADITLRVPK